LAQQEGAGKFVDSFEQGLLAQQLDGRIVEGELVDSFEQLFTVGTFEQQVPPIALVEQPPSFLVNSAVWVPDNCLSVAISV
jgi:hypothetical protein